MIFKNLGSAASTSNYRLENQFPSCCCQQNCACPRMLQGILQCKMQTHPTIFAMAAQQCFKCPDLPLGVTCVPLTLPPLLLSHPRKKELLNFFPYNRTTIAGKKKKKKILKSPNITETSDFLARPVIFSDVCFLSNCHSRWERGFRLT